MASTGAPWGSKANLKLPLASVRVVTSPASHLLLWLLSTKTKALAR